ncbi:hypothetical protein PN499_21430 [Kamptonema animale CS-326]|jgi:hypothetical protein|uniref:hypothetical protein n=1 Tax=Kamptonema animale TaxID=92934 RepID=UPI00232DC44E|nr:hypothetical protein [Kamptonema animale]MDB9513763.1 hypothetical protein [Kamptonema animale CS-326]
MFTLTNVRGAIALDMEANRICLVVFAVVGEEEGRRKREEGRRRKAERGRKAEGRMQKTISRATVSAVSHKNR